MPTGLENDAGHRGASGPDRGLHTDVWHGDRGFDLSVPVGWQVTALWPQTPPALTDQQIADCLSRPAGQTAIADACAGRLHPLIIVDRTSQPTPVARLLPHVLRQLKQAGIEPGAVRILVSTGPEGAPRPESLIKKLGPAAADCQVLIHDASRDAVDLGAIGPDLRLRVNPEVINSDFVIGIEGIYPQTAGWYSAGSRLATGVVAQETLRQLESRFPAQTTETAGKDEQAVLETIAERLRLHTMLTAQIDAERNLVRLACGDPGFYYPSELAFARATYCAPLPGDADVVVANAYPADLSLASVIETGLSPLLRASPGASRILLASCSEGAGYAPRKRSWWSAFKELAGASDEPHVPWAWPGSHQHPIWLHRPGHFTERLPPRTGDLRVADSWESVVNAVSREQLDRRYCRVYLYPCSPLQLLMPARVPGASGSAAR